MRINYHGLGHGHERRCDHVPSWPRGSPRGSPWHTLVSNKYHFKCNSDAVCHSFKQQISLQNTNNDIKWCLISLVLEVVVELCGQQDEGEVDDVCGGGGVVVLLGLVVVVVLKDLLMSDIKHLSSLL